MSEARALVTASAWQAAAALVIANAVVAVAERLGVDAAWVMVYVLLLTLGLIALRVFQQIAAAAARLDRDDS